MLERVVQLAAEIAKWEAEEKERQRLEGLRAARQQMGVPSSRPLMIRTGKAKTDGALPAPLPALVPVSLPTWTCAAQGLLHVHAARWLSCRLHPHACAVL